MMPNRSCVLFKWTNIRHGDLVEVEVINDGLHDVSELIVSTYRYQGKKYLIDPSKYKWVDKEKQIGVIKTKHLLIEMGNKENGINCEKQDFSCSES